VLLVLAILFLLRDQWVSFLRSIGALHNLDAKPIGPARRAPSSRFQHLCDLLLPSGPAALGLRFPIPLFYSLEALSMAINLISIVVYTSRFWPALRVELRPPDADGTNSPLSKCPVRSPGHRH